MHRFEWNDLIGDSLFGPERSQQPVFLYLSREKLIELGKRRMPDADEKAVWADFVRTVKSYSPRDGSLLEKIVAALTASLKATEFGGQTFETQFPPCLLLLALSVMPLVEEAERGEFNPNTYYRRVNRFFRNHGLPTITGQDATHNWNQAWQRLAEWSRAKDGEWGLFDDKLLSSNSYCYVGKAFAQCLLPTSAFRELPNAFDRMGWAPGQVLDADDVRQLVTREGPRLGLRANVLTAFRHGGDVAATVGQLVRREFSRWDGSSRHSRTTPVANSPKTAPAEPRAVELTHVSASLRFGFRLKNGFLDSFYRLQARQDYPEHLTLKGEGVTLEATESHNHWSEPLDLPFRPDGWQLNDELNRWKARALPAKGGCRLFIRGDYEGLSKGEWIETQEVVFDGSCMHVLVPTMLPDELTAWSGTFVGADWKECLDEIENLPSGHRLFKFRNPPTPPPWLAGGARAVPKNLFLYGGLAVRRNTYFRPVPPLVRVEGGTGTERVEAVLDDGKCRIQLVQNEEAPSLFHFPDDFPDEVAFLLHREGESLEGKELLHFTSRATTEVAEDFPKWNALGKRAELGQPSAVVGLEPQDTQYAFQLAHQHFFFPGDLLGQRCPPHPILSETSPGDFLLHFLSTKPAWSDEEFSNAFGQVSEEFGIWSERERLISRKRYALLDWDALGYIEYDPDGKRLYPNPPQLVPVRTRRGCRALLTGRRSMELMDDLRQALPAYPLLNLSIERADETDERLVPCSVFIQSDASAGRQQIEALAKHLDLPFRGKTLPQFGLLEASASLDDYWRWVHRSAPCDRAAFWDEWARPFQRDELQFKSGAFDSADALVEYPLQTWQREIRHWLDGTPYPADRNWGRYAVAARFEKTVQARSVERRELLPVFVKRGSDLAVPLSMPLPRFFARALTLMSGKLPRFAEISTAEWPQVMLYRVYQDAATTLTDNFLKKLGQPSTLAAK